MEQEGTVKLNYSSDQVTRLVNGYKAGEAVEVLAMELGKTVRSVVAKLVNEGVYDKSTNTTSVTSTETKAQLVAYIESFANLDQGVLKSLEKSDKVALSALVNVLRNKLYSFT